MKQADDTKRDQARRDKDRTQVRLDLLRFGFAHLLKHEYDVDVLSDIVLEALGLLPAAIHAAQEAGEAYRPYWRRRRNRIVRVPKKNPAKKKTAPKV